MRARRRKKRARHFESQIPQTAKPLSPPHLAHLLPARRLTTAKDMLSLPVVELMAVLDAGLPIARAAIAHVSEVACPPCQTALTLLEERVRLGGGGRLTTTLAGLDEALGGGIPLGKLTEVVGPSGIGKTQFCLKLALLAALPECYGGLNGRVVYIDTESKFSSRRMIEIGQKRFPQIFRQEGLAQKMAGRILVMRPTCLADFTKSLEQMKVTLLQHDVKLLLVDSMAALTSLFPSLHKVLVQRNDRFSHGRHIVFMQVQILSNEICCYC